MCRRRRAAPAWVRTAVPGGMVLVDYHVGEKWEGEGAGMGE